MTGAANQVVSTQENSNPACTTTTLCSQCGPVSNENSSAPLRQSGSDRCGVCAAASPIDPVLKKVSIDPPMLAWTMSTSAGSFNWPEDLITTAHQSHATPDGPIALPTLVNLHCMMTT